jgi:hypothetical protein
MKQSDSKSRKKIQCTICAILILTAISALFVVNGESTIFFETYGGDVGWINVESVIQVGDGGYILAGTNTTFYGECFLIKTGPNGKEQWTQRYGILGNCRAHSVAKTNDGGYIIAGSKTSTVDKTIIFSVSNYTYNFTLVHHADSDFLLIKTSSNGAIQWIKTFDGGGWGDEAYSVIETSDGGYAVAGWLGTWSIEYVERWGMGTNDFSYSKVWLIKTDEHGNMQWNQTYGGTNGGSGRSLVQTNDGGYAILGGYNNSQVSGKSDFLFIRTDASGRELWSKQYGGLSDDYGYSIVQSSDGGFALAGRMGYTNELDPSISYGFLLVKTDSNGVLEWEQRFGETKLGPAYAVVEASDGGFAVAGSNVLIKTDQFGTLLWNQSYSIRRAGDIKIYSMIETIDKGFALAGFIDIYSILIKTDENGMSTVTSSLITPKPTPTLSPSPSQEPQEAGSLEVILGIAIIGIVLGAAIVLLAYLMKKS